MLSVTKTFRFEAAHFLPFHKGKCKNMHGHNYKLEVTFADNLKKIGPDRGMVIDFGDLKELINSKIEMLDHQILNKWFENPTAENMLDELVKWIPDPRLYRLKLWETDDCYAEWTRDAD